MRIYSIKAHNRYISVPEFFLNLRHHFKCNEVRECNNRIKFSSAVFYFVNDFIYILCIRAYLNEPFFFKFHTVVTKYITYTFESVYACFYVIICADINGIFISISNKILPCNITSLDIVSTNIVRVKTVKESTYKYIRNTKLVHKSDVLLAML